MGASLKDKNFLPFFSKGDNFYRLEISSIVLEMGTTLKDKNLLPESKVLLYEEPQ